MLGRAKNHPNKTKDMGGAIKVFDDWLKKYNRKKNEKQDVKFFKKNNNFIHFNNTQHC